MRVATLIIGLLLVSLLGSAQTPDTSTVFTPDVFIQLVRTYHPLYKRADLLNRQADAVELRARGAFDPVLSYTYSEKRFDQKQYFQHQDGKLKLPTKWGFELEGGYTLNRGVFLNPEENVPTIGQAYAGIRIPLVRGLLTDQRRTALNQAKMFARENEATRLLQINNLFFNAIEAYWEWVLQYNENQIRQEAVEVALQRFDVVKNRFLQGDIPAVDTVEALVQLQNQQYALSESEKKLAETRFSLSDYLWDEDEQPLTLRANVSAPVIDSMLNNVSTLSDTIMNASLPADHPGLTQYDWKIKQLDIQQRLKREQLKPQLDIAYNFLANGTDFLPATDEEPSLAHSLFTENYKIGVEFSHPLFLRKARGDIEHVQVKILQTQLDRQNLELKLRNTLNTLQNQYIISLEQEQTLRAVKDNYERLLQAEMEMFRIGESSLFLVNSREQNLIKARVRLLQIQVRLEILKTGMHWAAGLLR